MSGLSTITTALDPYRWWAAGIGVVVLAGGVYWAYDWAYDRGYDAREKVQQEAEAKQKAINANFDADRIRDGSTQARRFDNLIDANNRKAASEKARLRTLPPVAAGNGMCNPTGTAGVPGLPNAGGNANACAGVSADLVEANRVGTNNADQVTALQAHIEASRAAYNKVTGQTDSRPVSDAESRWAARLKQAEDIAKRAEARANGVVK